MALQRGIVKLEDHNNDWNLEYEKEKELLKNVLKDYLEEIHHVGSTSIPNLKAKPIIDILLVIQSFKDIPKITEILEDYQYENRGQQGIPDRYFFAKGPDNARSHYLHVVEGHTDTYYNQLYFRDYLINHPEYVQKYNDLKEDLAKKYASERPKYTAGKKEFINNVIKLAKEEYKEN